MWNGLVTAFGNEVMQAETRRVKLLAEQEEHARKTHTARHVVHGPDGNASGVLTPRRSVE